MKKLIAVLAGVLLLLPSLTMALEPFNKDLRYGMVKNEEVKRMQEFLRNEGLYTGPITGNYYALTRDAVRKYQKNNGIKVTGLFDKVTRSKVNEMGVAISETVLGAPVADVAPSIPLGWVSNGDGTWSAPKESYTITNNVPSSVSYCSNCGFGTQPINKQVDDLQKKVLELQNQVDAHKSTTQSTNTSNQTQHTILNKAYQFSSEIPNQRSLYAESNSVDSVNLTKNSDKIINVIFNGLNKFSDNSQNYDIVNGLSANTEYTYSWTYREEGREDSVFSGKIKTKSPEDLVKCDGAGNENYHPSCTNLNKNGKILAVKMTISTNAVKLNEVRIKLDEVHGDIILQSDKQILDYTFVPQYDMQKLTFNITAPLRELGIGQTGSSLNIRINSVDFQYDGQKYTKIIN